MRKSRSARIVAPDPHAGAGRRMSPRVPVRSDCSVQWGESSVDGLLLDISTGGAAVELVSEVDLAASDEVVIEIPTVLSVVTVAATVVSQDEESFGTFVLRVRFGEISEELRGLIARREAAFRERQAAIFSGHI